MHSRTLPAATFLYTCTIIIGISWGQRNESYEQSRQIRQTRSPTELLHHLTNHHDQHQSLVVRILALFTGTSTDFGLDHRLGRQVLKLAAARARRLNPEVSNIEWLVYNDDSDCKSPSNIPIRVAEQFYAEQRPAPSSDHDGADCLSPASAGGEYQPNVKLAHESGFVCDTFHATARAKHISDQTTTPSRRNKSRIDAILGPSCDHLVDAVARMAAYWRTPIYTVTSISSQFGRKDVYPTLTRLSPSTDYLSLFIVKVMESFKWRHLAIVVDQNQTENLAILSNLERTIDHLRFSIPIVQKTFVFSSFAANETQPMVTNSEPSEDLTPIYNHCTRECHTLLDGIRRVARVVLLLLNDAQVVRRLLLCANELGLNNGEYTYLALNLGLRSSNSQSSADRQHTMADSGGQNDGGGSGGGGAMQNFDWFKEDDEKNNLVARQMFESLMVFSVKLPVSDEYNIFVEQTLDWAHQQYPNVRFDRSSVGPTAVALHDSLLLAVEAQKRKFLMESRTPTDPKARTSEVGRDMDTNESSDFQDDDSDASSLTPDSIPLLWNDHYPYGLMTDMHINSNGDQELDYILSDMEPELGVMRMVASYSKDTRQVQMVPNTYIHWPARVNAATQVLLHNDEPPLDEPECGFTGEAEQCVDRQNLYIALTIFSLFLISMAGIAAMGFERYRKIKYQMQLDDYWWKINWCDLEFLSTHQSSIGSNLAPNLLRQLNSATSGSGLGHQSLGGSVVSSAKHSLVSKRSAGTGKKSHSGQRKPLRIVGSDVSNAIVERPNDISKRRSAISLVVTPASGTGAQDDETSKELEKDGDDDSVSRGSQTVVKSSIFECQSRIIRSEFSTVVRMSTLAIYKNEIVIVKQLNGSSIEVSRSLLVELKNMRQLSNENLARLTGLCIEPEHLAIVYEYCSRGNLQDLLMNESVAMDWNLKYSIIGDIINGLNFIHTTLLDYHGRLKSTNLVLDGRFTVKLTDFGLKSLYNQLELIEDCPKDYDEYEIQKQQNSSFAMDNNVGTAVASSAAAGDDDKTRRQSTTHTIYNMDSVSMRAENVNRGSSGQFLGNPTWNDQSGMSKMCLKNRGSVRFFWTAPEHLRQRQPHLAGSKRGDIFSLAIVLCEIFTRKEPYYYGTNAKPRWQAIKRDRLRHQMQQQQIHPQVIGHDEYSSGRLLAGRQSDAMRATSHVQTGEPVADSTVIPSGGGSSVAKQSIVSRTRKHRSQASVGPITLGHGRETFKKQSSIDHVDTKNCVSRTSPAQINATGSTREQPVADGAKSLQKQHRADQPVRISASSPGIPTAASVVGENEPGTIGEEEDDEVSSIISHQQARETGSTREPRQRKASGSSVFSHELKGTGQVKSKGLDGHADHLQQDGELDAGEILDQLRMGVQPEPIRPYIPNYLLRDVDPRMMGLLRSCWNEAPNLRPTAIQVRNSLRKITKGATAKNYLDNLLDRLQTYASQLERIVDLKSADIIAEKERTEELLYQLVPRFVADKLKRSEPIIPQVFDGVTIFFSDIVGFEKYASVMSPSELVDLLNNIYSSFESIINSFDVTKIEVILDQFLVAAGISFQQQQDEGHIKQLENAANKKGDRPPKDEQQPQQLGGVGVPMGRKRKRILGALRRKNWSSEKSNKSNSKSSRDGESPAAEKEMGPTSGLTGSQQYNSGQQANSEARHSSGIDVDHYRRSSAEQIARMALCIRDLVKSFHFRQNLNSIESSEQQRQQEVNGCDGGKQQQRQTGGGGGSNFVAASFNIRIGIHSGKVCAGIVGLKRPKFCLIGDTVNVASRMHTNGKANRIQISSDTRELLKQVPGFSIEPRGRIEVKGKGMMETYWLESSY